MTTRKQEQIAAAASATIPPATTRPAAADYRYSGNGMWLANVPARDIPAQECQAAGYDTEAMVQSGLYEIVETETGKSDEPEI